MHNQSKNSTICEKNGVAVNFTVVEYSERVYWTTDRVLWGKNYSSEKGLHCKRWNHFEVDCIFLIRKEKFPEVMSPDTNLLRSILTFLEICIDVVPHKCFLENKDVFFHHCFIWCVKFIDLYDTSKIPTIEQNTDHDWLFWTNTQFNHLRADMEDGNITPR